MKLRLATGALAAAAVAIVAGSAHAAPKAAAKHVLPFIEDDFSKAVAEAKAAKKPVFVDVWAPW